MAEIGGIMVSALSAQRSTVNPALDDEPVIADNVGPLMQNIEVYV